MDLANYSRSLAQMINHEIIRDCNFACLKDSGIPEKDCVSNCASKGSQLFQAFDVVVKKEIPKLQGLSRIH